MNNQSASYQNLLETGILSKRVREAYAHLVNCHFCAHECGVNRLEGELGFCKTGKKAIISSYGRHLGEEDPIRGRYGSGTIFFSRCNLHCQFCQNYDISQRSSGDQVEPEDIAYIMLELQEMGCHNINLVSPSHVVPHILAGLLIAAAAGLKIPLVYNTGGYDHSDTLSLLDGIIDIYMPDMKYADSEIAMRYSRIPNYPQVNQVAVKEMHRQVGDLSCDDKGVAFRGLLIRHLILPNNLAGTKKILEFIANDISKRTYINLMDQYRPAYNAHKFPELNRRISSQEYQETLDIARRMGLDRLDKRQGNFFIF